MSFLSEGELEDNFEPDEEWWERQSESYAESRGRRSGVESVYLPRPQLGALRNGGNGLFDSPPRHNRTVHFSPGQTGELAATSPVQVQYYDPPEYPPMTEEELADFEEQEHASSEWRRRIRDAADSKSRGEVWIPSQEDDALDETGSQPNNEASVSHSEAEEVEVDILTRDEIQGPGVLKLVSRFDPQPFDPEDLLLRAGSSPGTSLLGGNSDLQLGSRSNSFLGSLGDDLDSNRRLSPDAIALDQSSPLLDDSPSSSPGSGSGSADVHRRLPEEILSSSATAEEEGVAGGGPPLPRSQSRGFSSAAPPVMLRPSSTSELSRKPSRNGGGSGVGATRPSHPHTTRSRQRSRARTLGGGGLGDAWLAKGRPLGGMDCPGYVDPRVDAEHVTTLAASETPGTDKLEAPIQHASGATSAKLPCAVCKKAKALHVVCTPFELELGRMVEERARHPECKKLLINVSLPKPFGLTVKPYRRSGSGIIITAISPSGNTARFNACSKRPLQLGDEIISVNDQHVGLTDVTTMDYPDILDLIGSQRSRTVQLMLLRRFVPPSSSVSEPSSSSGGRNGISHSSPSVLEEVIQRLRASGESVPQFLKQQLQHQKLCQKNAERLLKHGISSRAAQQQGDAGSRKPPLGGTDFRASADATASSSGRRGGASSSSAAGALPIPGRSESQDDNFLNSQQRSPSESGGLFMVVGSAPVAPNDRHHLHQPYAGENGDPTGRLFSGDPFADFDFDPSSTDPKEASNGLILIGDRDPRYPRPPSEPHAAEEDILTPISLGNQMKRSGSSQESLDKDLRKDPSRVGETTPGAQVSLLSESLARKEEEEEEEAKALRQSSSSDTGKQEDHPESKSGSDDSSSSSAVRKDASVQQQEPSSTTSSTVSASTFSFSRLFKRRRKAAQDPKTEDDPRDQQQQPQQQPSSSIGDGDVGHALSSSPGKGTAAPHLPQMTSNQLPQQNSIPQSPPSLQSSPVSATASLAVLEQLLPNCSEDSISRAAGVHRVLLPPPAALPRLGVSGTSDHGSFPVLPQDPEMADPSFRPQAVFRNPRHSYYISSAALPSDTETEFSRNSAPLPEQPGRQHRNRLSPTGTSRKDSRLSSRNRKSSTSLNSRAYRGSTKPMKRLLVTEAPAELLRTLDDAALLEQAERAAYLCELARLELQASVRRYQGLGKWLVGLKQELERRETVEEDEEGPGSLDEASESQGPKTPLAEETPAEGENEVMDEDSPSTPNKKSVESASEEEKESDTVSAAAAGEKEEEEEEEEEGEEEDTSDVLSAAESHPSPSSVSSESDSVESVSTAAEQTMEDSSPEKDRKEVASAPAADFDATAPRKREQEIQDPLVSGESQSQPRSEQEPTISDTADTAEDSVTEDHRTTAQHQLPSTESGGSPASHSGPAAAAGMWLCPVCHNQETREEALFCDLCGSELQQPPLPHRPHADSLSRISDSSNGGGGSGGRPYSYSFSVSLIDLDEGSEELGEYIVDIAEDETQVRFRRRSREDEAISLGASSTDGPLTTGQPTTDEEAEGVVSSEPSSSPADDQETALEPSSPPSSRRDGSPRPRLERLASDGSTATMIASSDRDLSPSSSPPKTLSRAASIDPITPVLSASTEPSSKGSTAEEQPETLQARPETETVPRHRADTSPIRIIAGERSPERTWTGPSEEIPNSPLQTGQTLFRYSFMKLHKFGKRSPRQVEIDLENHRITILKAAMRDKKGLRKDKGGELDEYGCYAQYVLTPAMLIDAVRSPSNNRRMRLVFVENNEGRLLRSKVAWQCQFENPFERERVYRFWQEFMNIYDLDRGSLEEATAVTAQGAEYTLIPRHSLDGSAVQTTTAAAAAAAAAAETNTVSSPPAATDASTTQTDGAQGQERQSPATSQGYRARPLKISPQVDNWVQAKLPVARLAGEIHQSWADNREMEGWICGPKLDPRAKTHPLLVGFEELPEEDQRYHQELARLALGTILELGYTIQPAHHHVQSHYQQQQLKQQREEQQQQQQKQQLQRHESPESLVPSLSLPQQQQDGDSGPTREGGSLAAHINPHHFSSEDPAAGPEDSKISRHSKKQLQKKLQQSRHRARTDLHRAKRSPHGPRDTVFNLTQLVELVAENLHENWSYERLVEGWDWGPRMDPKRRRHPNLTPYCDMSEQDKDLDREAANTVLSRLIQWRYTISKR